ncbi:sodium:alanine symporter family protein [Candidatus Babeliales bacterium]|nr:sodium:alanine symporter family protein [Candidatus Babeliales bacterium]
MNFPHWVSVFTDTLLLIPFIFVLFGSIVITIQTKWVQLRQLPLLGKTFLRSLTKKDPLHSQSTIPSYKALFTAMSTTIGTANIVGPIIAIGHGGPGALAGFLLATLFGCATTYVEVCFALSFRSKNRDGSINGGPMPYVKEALGSFWANVYAIAGATLLIA